MEVVYFLQSGDRIKIGCGNSRNRQRRLQTGNPENLVILTVIAGDKSKERELHERFSHLKVRGEWFESGPELLDFINEIRVKFPLQHELDLIEGKCSPLTKFLEECCVFKKFNIILHSDLQKRWEKWCKKNKEEPSLLPQDMKNIAPIKTRKYEGVVWHPGVGFKD